MKGSYRKIVLAQRPVGAPAAHNFRLEQARLRELLSGEMLVANLILSMDPAIRGMTLGRVIESKNAAYPEGSIVRTLAAWEEFSYLTGDALGLESLTATSGTPLEHYMGALGPAGLTAWIGLNEIGRAQRGETVLVSAAAGAVGNVVGQIARLQGCRVIGLAGSAAKTAQLRELGFHSAIDYRHTNDLAAAIRAAAPDGIHVYFDNVGGCTLETLLPLMADHGRVVVCGMVSEYNDQDHPYGVKTLWQLVVKRLTLRS